MAEEIEEHSKKIGYKDIIKEKEFLKYILAKMISRFGDSLDVIAYGFIVFQLTGSAAMLATLYAVNGIPSFIFNLISGSIVTYWPKKKVVYMCDFGRGFIVLLTAILLLTNNLQVWHLFIFTFMNSTFEAFRAPAAMPLFKKLIPVSKYSYAVSFDSMSSSLMELVGYALAGVILGTVGAAVAIIIDAVTFFICGIIILLIKVEKEIILKTKVPISQYSKDMVSGFKYIISKKTVLNVCIFAGIFNFFLVPFNSLQVAYVEDVLHKEPIFLSIMSVMFLVAMMIGGFIAPIMKKHMKGKKMMIIGGIGIAVGYLALSQLGIINQSQFLIVALVVSCLLMGISVPIMSLPVKVGIMTQIDEQYLSRSVSFVNSLGLSTAPIGGAIVGAIVAFISLENIYLIFSIALLILFIVQIFNKSLKEL